MRQYLAWPRQKCKSEIIVGARTDNQKDHKDPGYCTNQNLVCRGRQKAEVDPTGNSEIKSQSKEAKAENEKSSHAEENQNTLAI